MGTTTETRINSTQAKDAIYKAHELVGQDLVTQTNLSDNYPSMVLGVNLYNYKTRLEGFYCNRTSGSLIANASYSTSDYIEVAAVSLYSFSLNLTAVATNIDFIHFYDANKQWISSPQAIVSSFTTPANCQYVRFSGANTTMARENGFQLNKGSYKLQRPYIKILPSSVLPVNPLMGIEPTYTIITANSNPTATANFTGRRAVQNAIESIKDATIQNQYIIEATGIFEATEAAHFDVNGGSGANFIVGRDFVNLQGKGVFKIIGRLPSLVYYYNTVLWNCSSWIKDCEIIAINNRYAVHIEGDGFGNRFKQRKFTRVKMRSNGWIPLGYGKSPGEVLILDSCELESFGTTKGCLYVHTNPDFVERVHVIAINTNFITNGSAYLHAQNLGDGWNNTIELINCTVDGHLSVSSSGNSDYDDNPDTSKMDIQVKGLEPTPFDMNIHEFNGIDTCIKIESNTVGSTSKVRITGGTAFDDICGISTQIAEYQDKYGRMSAKGYSYVDATNGLKGYCLTGIDIHEFPKKVHRKSLGKRLGDCSTTNKTLTISVDNATAQTITFNKNYNGTASTVAAAYTNAQIIAEINAQLVGATASLYAYGQDYFPSFKDTAKLQNNGSSALLAGMGIIITGLTTCRVATNADGRIDGITMDDADVNKFCRIIKKGRLFAQSKGTRYSSLDGGAIMDYGVLLGISTTTAGVFDATASPKLLRSLGTNTVEIIR